VAFTVSGRPALVLQGAVPAYRDITPGAVGDDVRQLQAALGRLGFPARPHRMASTTTARAGRGRLVPEGRLDAVRPQRRAAAGAAAAQADWFTAEFRSPRGAGEPGRRPPRLRHRQQRAAAAAKALTPSATAVAAAAASPDSAAASRLEQERVSAAVRVGGPAGPWPRPTTTRRPPRPAWTKPGPAAAAVQRGVRRPGQAGQDASNAASAARDELSSAEEPWPPPAATRGRPAAPVRPPARPSRPLGQARRRHRPGRGAQAADAIAFAQRKVGLAGRRAGAGPSGAKLGIQIPPARSSSSPPFRPGSTT